MFQTKRGLGSLRAIKSPPYVDNNIVYCIVAQQIIIAK